MNIVPNINFEDFYKFIMSISLISIVLVFSLAFFSKSYLAWFLFVITLFISLGFINWAGKKWYSNQKILDEKLRSENELLKKESQKVNVPDRNLSNKKTNKNIALIEYKIDSVLPGTVHYDLINDGKVWFWLANLEDKKYKVYIDVEYLSENYFEKSKYNYYNGKKEWNLNVFTGIHAPGMDIPKEFIELAKKGKQVQIKVNCEVKDEEGKLVEKKLPISFIYDSKSKSWFLEP